MKQLWIMVAGPFSSGAKTNNEKTANHQAMNKVAYEIFEKGHIPIIGVNLALPIIELVGIDHNDELMMPISMSAATKCDAAIRIGGYSKGADQEIEQIRSQGGTIFYSLDEIPILKTS